MLGILNVLEGGIKPVVGLAEELLNLRLSNCYFIKDGKVTLIEDGRLMGWSMGILREVPLMWVSVLKRD